MTTEADLRARIAELEASRRLDLELDAYAKDADVAVARARAEAAEAALAEAVGVIRDLLSAEEDFEMSAEALEAARCASKAARTFVAKHVKLTDDGKAVCVRIGE